MTRYGSEDRTCVVSMDRFSGTVFTNMLKGAREPEGKRKKKNKNITVVAVLHLYVCLCGRFSLSLLWFESLSNHCICLCSSFVSLCGHYASPCIGFASVCGFFLFIVLSCLLWLVRVFFWSSYISLGSFRASLELFD